jgi:hypothetical protein
VARWHLLGVHDYRAVLTVDYSKTDDINAYQRLQNALCNAGWSYAETSALYIESCSLDPILVALELLSRYVTEPGMLSAMSFQVQLIGEDRDPPAAGSHKQAIPFILNYPLPSEK